MFTTASTAMLVTPRGSRINNETREFGETDDTGEIGRTRVFAKILSGSPGRRRPLLIKYEQRSGSCSTTSRPTS